MRASGEFSLERLRIAQCRFALRRQADVREHKVARRPVLLHEFNKAAFRSRTRFAEQEYVVILEVRDAPAILVRAVVPTTPGKRFQRKADGRRIPARHCKQFAHVVNDSRATKSQKYKQIEEWNSTDCVAVFRVQASKSPASRLKYSSVIRSSRSFDLWSSSPE